MSWQAFTWTEIQARTIRIPVPEVSWVAGYGLQALSFVSVFLPAFAFMEAALGVWRVCADLGWAGTFFVNTGLLSHWQVWLALAAFTEASALYVDRLVQAQRKPSGK